ncbi:hypothetical protein D9M69_665390 [compost metagenome]
MVTEVRYPPQRNILGVACQADCRGEQGPCAFNRLGLARLKREVEKRQGPADRRIEDGRQNLVDVRVLAS